MMPEISKIDVCSFCEKPRAEVPRLINGEKGAICNYCVVLCYEVLKDEGLDVTFQGTKTRDNSSSEEDGRK
jgi:ATP-dependent protease Clp ATPase subunit